MTRYLTLLMLPFVALSLTQCAQEEAPRVPTSHSAAVPFTVKAECLAELRKLIPDRTMQVVRSVKNGSSYVVDVRVDGVPHFWRCFHDGKRCTGTEYQGEG